jgi:hypothetical protein
MWLVTAFTVLLFSLVILTSSVRAFPQTAQKPNTNYGCTRRQWAIQECSGCDYVGSGWDRDEPSLHSHQTWNIQRTNLYSTRETLFHLVGDDAAKTILTFDLNANLPGPMVNRLGRFALRRR